ncbi:MAG TPA: hypothetical protein IAA48_06210 [Candidatus Eubacterium faecipullorum]|uniref:Uncharacterized protein n=1 Tax=Candidatus Eubacterium faecipullorum TaxID=2838571 RepID=A0A9D1RDY3_9FIRM|nr:hypothetical protein [Candidatus Eubacterium faecipullorum]
MTLTIDDELLQKCGGGSSEYWFSYRDYTIKSIYELEDLEKPEGIGQTAYLVSLGIIPFLTVSNEEIMRAFVKKRGSAKLNGILAKVHSEDFIETFWKYFNAYPELKDGLNEFAEKFLVEQLCEWCRENNISYELSADLQKRTA